MSIEILKEVNVDVYDRKIITVNAKQGDKSARYLSVNCYNQGVFIKLKNSEQTAIVRAVKPDGYCIFNDCVITNKGNVLVELTEQMLAVCGNAYLDIMIINEVNNDSKTDINNLNLNTGTIFTTMTICLNIGEANCNCWDIESSHEYKTLNNLLIQAQRNYIEVMTACKNSENNMISIQNCLGGVFSPRGTITFAELASSIKAPGYVYHVSDAFLTDDTFKEGAGVAYAAGTNVYYTADGYWDCFVGETLEVTDDDNGNVTMTLKFR